jgi:hypothetical protein
MTYVGTYPFSFYSHFTFFTLCFSTNMVVWFLAALEIWQGGLLLEILSMRDHHQALI